MTKKLNVLYVAHEGRMGGATKALLELVSKMNEKGHNVTVLLPFRHSILNQKLNEMGINTITQFYLWWEYPKNEGKKIELLYRIGYKFNSLAVAILRQKLKNKDFDIIHSNTSVLDIGMKLSEMLKIPHVWHFREFGYEDHKLVYIKGENKSLEEIRQSKSHLIYISKAIKDYYEEKIGAKKGDIIYDGVGDEYIWKKDTSNYAENSLVRFLISGALQPGKGQNFAIQAAGILKRTGYRNFKMYIAGRDISDYQNELEELCKSENVEELIEFKGFISNIEQLRRQCDVELVCSRKEAFGRVTIEAMLCSNPVIASDTGANVELVDDGINGYLYAYNDVRELARCMKSFLDDHELLVDMGKNAFIKAEKNFTAQKNADEIEKLYYKLVKEEGL